MTESDDVAVVEERRWQGKLVVERPFMLSPNWPRWSFQNGIHSFYERSLLRNVKFTGDRREPFPQLISDNMLERWIVDPLPSPMCTHVCGRRSNFRKSLLLKSMKWRKNLIVLFSALPCVRLCLRSASPHAPSRLHPFRSTPCRLLSPTTLLTASSDLRITLRTRLHIRIAAPPPLPRSVPFPAAATVTSAPPSTTAPPTPTFTAPPATVATVWSDQEAASPLSVAATTPHRRRTTPGRRQIHRHTAPSHSGGVPYSTFPFFRSPPPPLAPIFLLSPSLEVAVRVWVGYMRRGGTSGFDVSGPLPL
jgi:hypothetical protein